MKPLIFIPLLMASLTMPAGGGTGAKEPSTGDSVDAGPKRYAQGIWIDWNHRAVELDARVCLRKGLLELLACSPNTREHESILVVPGRPRDIYHAMGLIGLEPGSPVRFDEKKEKWLPPSGDRLHLTIRFDVKGKERSVLASDWLQSTSDGQVTRDIPWVFAGSRSWADGQFAGDTEGTVVTVVDFESALIAVGASHTSDNDALWLQANTDAIPPIGTTCRLIVSAYRQVIELMVQSDGSFVLHGKAVTPAEVKRLFRDARSTNRPIEITLTPAADSSAHVAVSALERLVLAGIDRNSVKLKRQTDTHSTTGQDQQ